MITEALAPIETERALTFGSLFTGVGGFDLGFERAGMQCLWQCEIDKHATAVLEKHWPNTTRYTDVREIGKHNLAAVDVICGGFPCQDLSVAGHRKGLAGERSGLWFEFHRILEEVRPRWCVIENVPGLLSSHKGRDFAVLLSGLVELGYSVTWRVLDSQYFGVAQRRRRVFIVGSLGNGRTAEVLLESEGVPGDTAKGREAGEGTAVPTLRGFGHGWQGQHNDTHAIVYTAGQFCGYDEDDKFRALQASQQQSMKNNTPIIYNIHQNDDGRKDRPEGGLYVQETDTSLTLQSSGQGKGQTIVAYNIVQQDDDRNDGRGDIRATESDKSLTLQTGPAKSQTIVLASGQMIEASGITKDIAPTLQLLHEQPIVTVGALTTGKDRGAPASNQEVYAGHIVWQMNHAAEVYRDAGELVPTLQERMGTGGNNVPLVGLRRLTPTECERLQGFPDGWTEGQSDTQRYKQMGNAVTVNVIEWIGRRIVEANNDK